MKLIVTDIKEPDFNVDGEYRIIRPDSHVRNCMGCFGCWVKTPGKCIMNDGYENIGSYMAKCDELIFISRCCYGSLSPFVKMIQDRSIPYNHPDFVIRNGEMHHKRRYDNTIKVSAYFYGEGITDKEKETAKSLIQGNADNFYGNVDRICFFGSAAELEGITL